MAFSISEFNSKINKHGLARDNLFLVRITPPQNLSVDMPTSDLVFFCNSVALPALNVSTADVRRQGYGKADKRPTGLPLDDLNTVFMVDSGFKVKQFFHRWIQSTINFDDSRGYDFEYNRMLPYEVSYKKNYVGKVDVVVYSYNSREFTYSYQFDNAYPTALGDVTTAWGNNDAFMVMPVQFSYDTYVVDGVGESQRTNRINSVRGVPGSNQSGFFTSLGNFGQTLDAIGIDTPIQDAVNQFTTVASQANFGLNAVRSIF